MLDPRIYGIKEKTKNIKRIISIVSGKGGVGKSTIASTMSILLAKKRYKTGLLDLDFHGPTCHMVLGIDKFQYEEEKGILPYEVEGIRFASIYPFVEEKAVPLRGYDISNAIIEFLAIINWGDLDYLIIDMPPGMGDPFLDVVRYLPKAEYIVITTGSILSISTVARLVDFLVKQNYRTIGLIENMQTNIMRGVEKIVEKFKIRLLGSISFDPYLENALGNIDMITKTKFAEDLDKIIRSII
ncbi:MAG: ATP-binding protein [Candidatus Njordarchaeota archaeon]